MQMNILKTVEALQSYSESLIGYKLDLEFAEAVTDSVKLLVEQGERIADLENKLATVNGGWIPVSLGFMPDDYISVLAYIPTEAPCPTVREAYRVGDTWVTKGWFYNDSDISHWMHIPDPPEEVRPCSR